MTNRFYVGVDLGQVRDFTAIAVVERCEAPGEWDAVMAAYRKRKWLAVRHLERIPLGTPYTEVAERVGQVTRSGELAGRCETIVDATGVGRPVVEMLRGARLDGMLTPVLITGGESTRSTDGYYRVPKRDLIVGLQVLLQVKELKIAPGLEWGRELVREMAEMEVRVTAGGNEQYGAWREGEHDDLVLAIGLACWGGEGRHPRRGVEYWQYPVLRR